MAPPRELPSTEASKITPSRMSEKTDIKEKEGDFSMNNIGATQCTQMD